MNLKGGKWRCQGGRGEFKSVPIVLTIVVFFKEGSSMSC